jgi:hypothetical protein
VHRAHSAHEVLATAAAVTDRAAVERQWQALAAAQDEAAADLARRQLAERHAFERLQERQREWFAVSILEARARVRTEIERICGEVCVAHCFFFIFFIFFYFFFIKKIRF